MSPDDIFAANMWVWPDPLLKRDAMGRILFVNAAFLQLYGGRVENWAGNPVQGWPTPTGQGAPYRFETRIPSPQGEIVYDWVELTMADGNALAIARDVTIFQSPPPQGLPFNQDPSHVANTAAVQNTASASALQTSHPVQASAQEHLAPELPTMPEVATPEIAPIEHAPNSEAQIAQAPVQEFMPAAPPIVETTPPTEPTVAAAPMLGATLEPAAPLASPVSAPNVSETEAAPQEQFIPHTADTPIEQAEPLQRDFERRALPIEDGDAVLGSNWRDAVIARAVGADDETDESSALSSTEQSSPQKTDAEGSSGNLKILLAEDNAINALLTRTLLEADGCIVETVEDGALAVQAMEDNMYDLIFMDMRMPNMDGLEATRKIRAMGTRTADVPIIALTANAFDDDRNACFDSGMNDFMTKPVSAEELSHMVTTWTSKKTKAEVAA